jgi:hypothetical protein
MADTSHLRATPPVEGDGISYSGIGWFLVVLTLTTLFCQGIVWGMFEFMEYRVNASDPPRAALAPAQGSPAIENGHLASGAIDPPPPTLLVNEPTVLREFRQAEDKTLSSYAWIDKTAGTVRLPLERAKELVFERGLPIRAAAAPAAAAPAKTAAPATVPAARSGH